MEEITIYAALLRCKTEREVKSFLTDLLSKSERRMAESRWEIAKTAMATNCGQREAMREHRATQDQVHRVFDAVRRRGSGYRLIYERLLDERNNDRATLTLLTDDSDAAAK